VLVEPVAFDDYAVAILRSILRSRRVTSFACDEKVEQEVVKVLRQPSE
jgi:hypothetical protein